MKLFDVFTIKKRNFIVKEKDMIEVLNMIQSGKSEGYCTGQINVGNSGSTEGTDLWFIHVYLTDKQWKGLLIECKNKKYQLVIKENPNDMYFTKMEGSE